MRRVRGWMRRAAGVFNLQREDYEAREEIESHIQLHIEDNLRAGMTPEQARREAVIKLGGVESTIEACREQNGIPVLEAFFQDLRHGLRMLRKSPGFTLVATMTLALGIGANTAIFSLVNALLFRPLPFREPGQLVSIFNPNPGAGGIPGLIGSANFRDWRELAGSFEALAAHLPSFSERLEMTLTGQGEPARVKAAYVTGNFLEVLGVQPKLGRNFAAEECQRNGPRSLILTDGLWRSRFQNDPKIVGRAVTINNETWTVVGVLPEQFDFSSVFRTGSKGVDFLKPFQDVPGLDHWGNLMAVIGRIRGKTTLSQAQAGIDRLNRQLEEAHPERGRISARLTPLRVAISGRFRRPFMLLACGAGAVLLIACANLSNLLLARGAARRKEIAVRAALGASRWRLVRQMLAEGALLSTLGTILGLLLSKLVVHWIVRSDAFNVPLLQTARVDNLGLGFTLVIAILTTLLFGMIPALQLSRANVQGDLKESGRGSGPGKETAWMRGALIVSEVALACVLLIAAGLLTRSFIHLLDIDPGFRAEQAAAWRIQPNRHFASDKEESAFYEEIIRRIEEIPLVESTTFPDKLPFELNDLSNVRAKGKSYSQKDIPSVFVGMVDHRYFRTMRIPVRGGRDFDSHDGRFDWQSSVQKVAIINEKFAQDYWPGENAIGQIVFIDGPPDPPAECRIIGVAGNVRQSALELESGPEIFVLRGRGGRNLVVRSKGNLKALIPLVGNILRQIDPSMAVEAPQPLRQIVDRAIAPKKLISLLLGLFSVLALLLAAVGIYGLIAYSVSQRTQEIGIRLAFGSPRGAVVRLIIRQGMGVVFLGCGIGVIGSLAITHLMRTLLFEVGTGDLASFILGGTLLLGVALLASWLPASRASRVQPMDALRWD